MKYLRKQNDQQVVKVWLKYQTALNTHCIQHHTQALCDIVGLLVTFVQSEDSLKNLGKLFLESILVHHMCHVANCFND
uniref:Uncharacterized protein n=1 Tax=Arion vulgaris TaxID=1028688 RepID=A0A0B6Y7T0_9EUPU